MVTLDDYNANILDLIPCLLEKEVKEKLNKEIKNASETESKLVKESVREKTSAALLLIGADHERNNKMKYCFQQNMAAQNK